MDLPRVGLPAQPSGNTPKSSARPNTGQQVNIPRDQLVLSGAVPIQVNNRVKPGDDFNRLLNQGVNQMDTYKPVLEQALKEAPIATERASVDEAMLPEDGSFEAASFQMAYDPEESGDATNLPFIQAMARIGQKEGFKIVVTSTDEGLATLKKNLDPEVRDAIVAVPIPKAAALSDWAQDNGESLSSGAIVIPRRHASKVMGSALDAHYLKARIARYQKAGYAQEDAKSMADSFRYIGAVDGGDETRSKIALGIAKGTKVIEAQTYFEGGDILSGTGPDGKRYAIVGKDQVSLNQTLLSRSLGHPVTWADTVEQMAKDLGVAPDSLIPVEEPGDYHLDMAMQVVGNQTVVLNDAVEAAKMRASWLRADHEKVKPRDPSKLTVWKTQGKKIEEDIRDLEVEAKTKAKLEDLTAKDLEAAGFKVKRMAGVFPPTSTHEAMNFMNVVQGKNPQGNRFAIMLGGESWAQDYVFKKLHDEFAVGMDHIYFLDPQETGKTLDALGGIACRVKALDERRPTIQNQGVQGGK
jgi:hypothetical protein